MATWAKIKLFWNTMLGSAGSTLTATFTESTGDYDVDYIYNMLEVNSWKAANTTDPVYITYDAGAGNTRTADYLAIAAHNLHTIGASVTLQYSTDNFSADVNDAFTEDFVGSTGSDLVTNGGFPSDTTGWIGGQSTLASIAGGESGNCLEITRTSGSSQNAYQSISGLTIGKWYKVWVYVKSGSSGDETFRIGLTTAGIGAWAGYYEGTSSSTWTPYYVLVQATNTTMVIIVIKNSATAGTMLFDTAIMYEAVSENDVAYLKEFTSQDKRYWRLKISGTFSVAPNMAICIWGLKTELDYAELNTDPHAQDVKANVGLSQGGYVAGIHTKYIERSLALRFNDVSTPDGWDSDTTNLYYKMFTWWNTHGLKNLFVAWETANRAADVWLMRPAPKFNNPLVKGGAFRNVSINLKGRKE